jgi:anti-anti-sigma factor
VRTRDLCTQPSSFDGPDDQAFAVNITHEHGDRIVHVSGELDVASRNVMSRACLENGDKSVVVEMAEMTFMDCCGYGGLVAARQVLAQHGGTLTLRNQTGQPADLLVMLKTLEAHR